MSALQIEYCNAIVADGSPTAIWSKLVRMRALAKKALRGEDDKLHEAEISGLFEGPSHGCINPLGIVSFS
ncbi:MAG: hypothetical protein WBE25_17620, partial [Xanthobacteraceae bacterium]